MRDQSGTAVIEARSVGFRGKKPGFLSTKEVRDSLDIRGRRMRQPSQHALPGNKPFCDHPVANRLSRASEWNEQCIGQAPAFGSKPFIGLLRQKWMAGDACSGIIPAVFKDWVTQCRREMGKIGMRTPQVTGCTNAKLVRKSNMVKKGDQI